MTGAAITQRFAIITLVSSLLLQSLDEYNPWVTRHGLNELKRSPNNYIGWHIRTPHGESKLSYSPNIHTYILQESAELVCSAFEEATAGIRTTCPQLFMDDMEIYISSTRYLRRPYASAMHRLG